MENEAEAGGDFSWDEIEPRAIHPVQVQMIEALLYIGRPLTVADFFRLFDGKPSTMALLHHVERLIRVGVLAVDGWERIRGAKVRLLRLARRSDQQNVDA